MMTPKNKEEITFSCHRCEYNLGRNRIGCGGHCLKKIMYLGGATYLKNNIVSSKSKQKRNNSGKYKLVICEKPSVAMQIAKLMNANQRKDGYMEGSGWRISWCLGHLVRLAQPDEFDPKLKKWTLDTLPIIPDQWTYLPEKGKEKQLNTLKKLMNADEVSSIINACDSGREGELIFRQVYNYCGCTKPFVRLWIHSMEDKAILDGFSNLRPSTEFDHLYQAALCRSQADFLVGINATRKYGILAHRKGMTIGRVQSPLLTMLVERAKKIENFQPVPYFNVHLNADGVEAVKEKIFDQGEADNLLERCSSQSAVVKSVVRKEKTVKPPKLYDLTMLQREANRLFGYSAKETLDTAQTLYEKKLISYPRTDSQYITEDMEKSVKTLVGAAGSALGVTVDFLPNVSPITDNSKVSDHYALLPTAVLSPDTLDELPEQLRHILSLICHRLLCGTGAEHIYEETTVTLECGGEQFRAKGRRIIQEGWKAFELNQRDCAEKYLPMLEEGQVLENVTLNCTDHQTTLPDAYCEDTLLAAMEQAGKTDFENHVERFGLGTPATRATIIEKVISSGYAVRKGKHLIPTELGRRLAEVLPEQLRSADLTAEWENNLLRIAKGELSPDSFMKQIYSLTNELVEVGSEAERVQELRFFDAEPVGKCPRCGAPIYEEGPIGFFCSGLNCNWALWKNSGYLAAAGVTLDRKLAVQLCEHGRAHVTNIKFEDSDEGDLLLVETGEKYPSYKYVKCKQDEQSVQNAS
jgi:DNA topoisomerase-3